MRTTSASIWLTLIALAAPPVSGQNHAAYPTAGSRAQPASARSPKIRPATQTSIQRARMSVQEPASNPATHSVMSQPLVRPKSGAIAPAIRQPARNDPANSRAYRSQPLPRPEVLPRSIDFQRGTQRSMPKLPRVRTAGMSEDLPSIMGKVPSAAPQFDVRHSNPHISHSNPDSLNVAVAQNAIPIDAEVNQANPADYRTTYTSTVESYEPEVSSPRYQPSQGAVVQYGQPHVAKRASWSVFQRRRPQGPLLDRNASRHVVRQANPIAPTQHVEQITTEPIPVAHYDDAQYTNAGCDAGCGGGYSPCRTGAFVEQLGSTVSSYADQHIHNGRRAQMVMYRYDFGPMPDSIELNAAGRRKLVRLARSFHLAGTPLVIESVPGRPDLGEARRAQVVSMMSQVSGVGFSDSQVVVQPTSLYGLRGPDAEVVNNNELQTLQSRGESFSGSRGSSSFSTSTTSGQ